jgi:uncharacterized secreted protein with C-terminal beta-propeller domain
MIGSNGEIKTYIGVILVSITLLGTIFLVSPSSQGYTYELKNFQTYDELLGFLSSHYHNYSRFYGNGWNDVVVSFAESGNSPSMDTNKGGSSVDYSETNVQVEGVDEPDIVKTDGTYLYMVAKHKIYILKAYPAAEAVLVSEISLDDEVIPCDIFIEKNCLVVFGNLYEHSMQNHRYEYSYHWGGFSNTIINVYNVKDPENPSLEHEIEMDGMYFDSRLIDDYVYVIINEYASDLFHVENEKEELHIPTLIINNRKEYISPRSIYYVDIPQSSDCLTHILSINIWDGDVNQKSFMLGSSQSMYVSQNNIFLITNQYDYIEPLIDGIGGGVYEQSTIIHKISVDERDVSYTAQGNVPGRVLNQFSMDEYNDFFRIATQVNGNWWYDDQTTNVYILDENLKRVSEIENIAPGEYMHSARFISDKAYLVTFKKVDPFFTLDLSDPYNPQILGKLKIPGYSDYLHPFDDNHIIGIGKDTIEPEEDESWGRDFAWYQGIKIALFDVSDFDNPKEKAKIIIGDRGTDSPALYDHKAFLFDHEKELLAIPIRLCEISDVIKEQNKGYTGNIYGECTFQGAYVYQLNLRNGFEYKGRITHNEEMNNDHSWWDLWDSTTISRSLFIDETLYTISESMVKMNDLNTIEEINSVIL